MPVPAGPVGPNGAALAVSCGLHYRRLNFTLAVAGALHYGPNAAVLAASISSPSFGLGLHLCYSRSSTGTSAFASSIFLSYKSWVVMGINSIRLFQWCWYYTLSVIIQWLVSSLYVVRLVTDIVPLSISILIIYGPLF
ncbi:hypothetical protein BKA56DRAFT_656041 [Ilyonectria sp. MPI-CAGE-AT-0026]|nr:hypothetical protein BKA56DRAFT_656041 [Ilyonectria sp. MPI-CAGE-AT-0026]